MPNQRRSERQTCAELVNINTDTRKDRAAITKDLSANGMRFQSRSKFALGERVDVLIHISTVGYKKATGRIVRTSLPPDYGSFFPHPAAVEFDAPLADA